MQFIFVPGLGADSRIFVNELTCFQGSIAIDWIPPLPSERLEEYAKRLAQSITPIRPCVVVGLSFGGMLAPYIAKEIQAVHCILLSSVKSGKEFPCWFRFGYPIFVNFTWIACFLVLLGKLVVWLCYWLVPLKYKTICQQYMQSPTERMVIFMKMMFVWAFDTSRYNTDMFLSITQIHGSRDWIIPARKTEADLIIPHAGHLFLLSHPDLLHNVLISHIIN